MPTSLSLNLVTKLHGANCGVWFESILFLVVFCINFQAGLSDTGPCNVSSNVNEQKREVYNEEFTFNLLKENETNHTETPLIDLPSPLVVHRNGESQGDESNMSTLNHPCETADISKQQFLGELVGTVVVLIDILLQICYSCVLSDDSLIILMTRKCQTSSN